MIRAPSKARRLDRRAVRIGLVAGVALGVTGAAAFLFTRATTPAAAGPVPHFVEEGLQADVDHVYDGDFTASVGGGIAVFDCNADGRPEMYVAGGTNPAALYRNDSPVGAALRFEPLHDAVTDITNVNGAYPLDVDGDGQVDLAVLRLGESVLLRGLGDCRFARANESWQFDGGNGWATAFSAKWEGANALPTLAIGHYLTLDEAADGTRSCVDNALIRPATGGAGFGPPIILTPGYCSLSMLFTDWDRSGRRDLRVSNDRHYYDAVDGEEQLWRVAQGEAPRRYTDADGWVQMQIEGMGIASYDLTNDGYPEVYLTSQAVNRLQTLTSGPGQPTYRDIGRRRGVEATRPFTGGDPLPSTAWHPEFQDVNNDGFIDLFVSKGNIDEQLDFASKDPSNLMLGNPDGTFTERAEQAGTVSFAKGRGAALVDFNLDGLLDLVEVNFQSRVLLWRNVGSGDATRPAPMGHWLALRPTQPGPNRDAIGSWVEVKVGDLTLRRELTVGGGHVGGQLGWTHFGLGPAESAEVRVQWPDGEPGPWIQVAADQFAVIERGATSASPWLAPAD
ncbi:MAG: CRTAC1 family protein [Chloroflexota bacterium]